MADHASNTKQGVCIYYKESLGVCVIDIPNLTKSICQITINNKTGYVLVVYRSPSQSSDDLKIFLSSLDQVITDMSLSNLAFRLILEDFNCRSNSWWEGDISTKEGIDLESVASCHGLHQLITDPTHSSSVFLFHWLNLYWPASFGNWQWCSFLLECQLPPSNNVLPVKFENCLPPPYECLVWNYKKGDVIAIRKALDLVNWDFIFLTKTVHY